MAEPNKDGRLAIQEAAIRLGLSRESVLRRMSSGELEGGKDGLSGQWYVTVESLEQYLADATPAA